MPSVKIKNFKFGLDTRRSELESQPGTLLRFVNGHINQGGEAEKRFGFFRQPRPAGTFGLQATDEGIMVFGAKPRLTATEVIDPGLLTAGTYQYKVTLRVASGDEFYCTMGNATVTLVGANKVSLTNIPIGQGADVVSRVIYRTEVGGSVFKFLTTVIGNVTETFTDNIADASLGAVFAPVGDELIYQKLLHPDPVTQSISTGGLTDCLFSECYGGKAFVVMRGNTATEAFAYFDGTLVKDFTNGLVLAHFLTHPVPRSKIAAHIASIADDTPEYEGAVETVGTASRARTANVATVVTSSAHNLATGDFVDITGLGGNYDVINTAITVVNPTTFTYASLDPDEVTTADTDGVVTKLEYVIIEGRTGVDFTLTDSDTSASGDLSTPSLKREEIAFKEGVSSTAFFKIMAGSDIAATAAAATGTLTRDGTNPSNGDFVIIGSKRYTFKTTPVVEGDVDIGAAASDTLTNLKKAINHESGNGTDYFCFQAHPYVTAGTIAGSVLPLTATEGSNGNSTVLTESITPAWAFSGTDLAGGAGNCIASVKVISPAQVVTELLNTAVDYSVDNETTATAVAQEINNNTAAGLTHGYTATSTDNIVSIFSAENASPMPNGYVLQVTVGGNVCVGDCMFFFTVDGPADTTITINAGGVIVLPTTVSYPAGFAGAGVNTFAELYAYIEATINAETGFHNIVAKASTDFMQLSRLVTRSDDISLPVTISFNPGTGGLGHTFGPPPTAPTPMQITVPGAVFDVIDNGANQGGVQFAGTTVVGVVVTGGIAPFVYDWREEVTGSATGSGLGGTGTQNSGQPFWRMGVIANNLPQTVFTIVGPAGLFQGNYIGRFVVQVTDSVGTVVISQTIVVNIYVDED